MPSGANKGRVGAGVRTGVRSSTVAFVHGVLSSTKGLFANAIVEDLTPVLTPSVPGVHDHREAGRQVEQLLGSVQRRGIEEHGIAG